MGFNHRISRRCRSVNSFFPALAGLALAFSLFPPVWAETPPAVSLSVSSEASPGVSPYAPMVAEQTGITAPKPTEAQKSQTGDRMDVDELLKNYMASMVYTPQAVMVPDDPVVSSSLTLTVPWASMPDAPDAMPGSDSDIELSKPAELQAVKPVKPPKARKLNFGQPVLNAVISSPFGWRWGRMHEGVDLAVNQGTPILATEAGKVVYSGWASGYGNFVSIDHGGGFVSHYGHASALLVHVGQKVKKGQTIALVGSTGHSTGPHLHFEVVSNGKYQNPLAMINKAVQLSAQ